MVNRTILLVLGCLVVAGLAGLGAIRKLRRK